jgi:hypothetical protein
LLIGIFRFAALRAVILNKAMSLVVMASALQFRTGVVPFAAVAAHSPIIANPAKAYSGRFDPLSTAYGPRADPHLMMGRPKILPRIAARTLCRETREVFVDTI